MDFFRQLFASKGAVGGLDLGATSVKLIQMRPKRDKSYEMASLLMGSTPAMTIKDGWITDPRALGDSIKQLILANNINVQKVVSAVSGPKVIMRPVNMHKMHERELAQSLKFEADKYLPYSVSEALITGTILRKELEEDPKMMEVLLIAAPNEIVKNTQDVVRFAGITPEGIDMEPLALMRSLELCIEPEMFRRTVALINLGASSTSIIIYKTGVLRTYRNVMVAGNSFTKVIGQSLNLSFEEAEKIKKDKGVIRVEKDAAPVAPTTMRIFNVIIPVLTELVTEIQRSFDYYRSKYRGENIDLVVLSGGSARFRNIDAYISNELGIPCRIANPLRNIDVSRVSGYSPDMLEELAPSLMAAIGICLKSATK